MGIRITKEPTKDLCSICLQGFDIEDNKIDSDYGNYQYKTLKGRLVHDDCWDDNVTEEETGN